MSQLTALTAALIATAVVLAGCSRQSPAGPSSASSLAVANQASAVPTSVQPSSSPPPFVFPDGCCYYNGMVVRTVVPPAINPQEGRDNFYGIAGQKGVVAVAPGDTDYHGGHWKFFLVTFNVTPYLLTSEADVLAAEAAGDVSIVRDQTMDFKCPIQP